MGYMCLHLELVRSLLLPPHSLLWLHLLRLYLLLFLLLCIRGFSLCLGNDAAATEVLLGSVEGFQALQPQQPLGSCTCC